LGRRSSFAHESSISERATVSGQSEKQRPSLAFWFMGLVCLTGLYLASFGPIVGMYNRRWISGNEFDSLFHTAYFPLAYMHDNTSFFDEHRVGKAYAWYVNLWGPVIKRD
jgi:hypothetical protein